MPIDPLAYPIPRTDPGAPPVEQYALLRRDRPVCPINLATGDPAWLVTSYEHARTVLSDRRFSRQAVFADGAPRYQATLPNPDSVQNMDPPRHTRVRGLANQAFSARRVELLRPRIAEITAELLDDMAAAGGPVDLNLAFGRPLPLRVICEMLGVPFADQQLFVDWTERIMSLGEFTGEEIARAFAEMKAYFKDLVAAKRADPGEDLLSVLTSVADGEGTLTESEVMHLGTAILVAGHDTSVTVIAGATLTLMNNPDQVALLRRDPGRWPAAVEELIRLDNPGVVINPRIATCDIALGDVVIPKGAAVLAHVGAASRDEAVLEDPDAFDVTRVAGPLLSLGHGPHFCIGASLAKAELEIGLRALFERFPELRLAIGPDQLEWRDRAALGGFKQFPVIW